jgi:hypothetical protein|tara:strand:- start:9940 stop:10914 length:975 start_codon:yes stop_codon:yes gene_type:complete
MDLTSFYGHKHDIIYPTTSAVTLNKKKKPTRSWMKDWPAEERVQKFFEFCTKFDEREDGLLKEDYQIFSHRLHWHEHPFCEVMQDVTDDFNRMWYTLVFSFSNEHWQTLRTLMTEGEEGLRKRFETHRHARNDLFQIYYPKSTKVNKWLIEGTKKAATDMCEILSAKNSTYTMMELAKIMSNYFATEQNFRNPMYPCKNFARYIAMAYPHVCDPNSLLFGGTGHFDGMQQIFDGPNLMGKVKYDIDENGDMLFLNKHGETWIDQMNFLADHKDNPIKEQVMLNIEDKTCFFYKHIAIRHGIKSPTKRIPYNWIFPEEFSLRKIH